MKKLTLICCLVISATLSAQSLEEQYRSFQREKIKSYTNFRDQANNRYADFLRSSWIFYQQSPAIPQPKEKPVPPLVYNEQEQQEQRIEAEVIPAPAPVPAPQPVAPIQENKRQQNSIEVIYEGTPFTFRVPQQQLHLTNTNGEALAKAWKTMATDTYDNMLYDCLNNRDSYHLCDWAYIQLVGTLASQLYTSPNEVTLMHAFILAQSGYAMRLAQSQSGRLYVLIGSRYQMYERPYYEINGLYFYPLTNVPDGLQINAGAFDKEQPFSLSIDPNQRLTMDEQTVPVRESEQGIAASAVVNRNAIHFYNTYPTGQVGGDCGSRWATYANAPMEECVRQSLYPTLMKAISGVPESQAVNKLLNWVQTAFEYEYDEKVWGHDRAFFPSETLHYPYSDCEDRSILFSRIVRDLMDLDVVLLYYPGHLATAVAFQQDVRGDYIQVNGKKYVVCDPTYMGAPVGRTMPGMDNLTAKVIPLVK